MKDKIAIIGTVGLPAKYGGFETLAKHLVHQLADRYNITVYCSTKKYKRAERRKTYNGAALKFLPFDANGIQSIFYDTLSILHALFYADVLLILGVAGAWTLPFVRLFTNKKIVISIDGIEWKRDKWNMLAKLYLRWAEKLAVRYSHIDISDNESIQDYTALRYGTISRVVEYGADHTEQVQISKEDIERYPFLATNYSFKVCRIEPENNVHLILDAFSQLPDKTLVVVGNWEVNEYGQTLKSKYGKCQNLILLNPIYNQTELDLLRSNASLYVHGHSAGGTNPSLVEAMYLELPVIAYDVSYNRTTTEKKAFYFKTTEDLVELIQKTELSKLIAVGSTMKEIADRRYRWRFIAEEYHQLFQEAKTTSRKPRIKPSVSPTSNKLEQLQAQHLTNSKLVFEK
jgi:glycosyltransferase involved in cell wall biosynthesis